MSRSPTAHWTMYTVTTVTPSVLAMIILWDEASRDDIGPGLMLFTLTIWIAVVGVLFLPLALVTRPTNPVISGHDASRYMGAAILASQAIGATAYAFFNAGRIGTIAVLCGGALVSILSGFAIHSKEHRPNADTLSSSSNPTCG